MYLDFFRAVSTWFWNVSEAHNYFPMLITSGLGVMATPVMKCCLYHPLDNQLEVWKENKDPQWQIISSNLTPLWCDSFLMVSKLENKLYSRPIMVSVFFAKCNVFLDFGISEHSVRRVLHMLRSLFPHCFGANCIFFFQCSLECLKSVVHFY